MSFFKLMFPGLHNAGIVVTPIFNGSSETMHVQEWHKRQLAVRKRLAPLFRQLHQQQHRSNTGGVGGGGDAGNRHAARISKHLWVSPSCLELALRMAFRQLRLPTVCTMDDHRREVRLLYLSLSTWRIQKSCFIISYKICMKLLPTVLLRICEH